MRRKTAHTVRYLRSREYLSRRLHARPLPFHELANITKTAEFAIENINRINSEIEKFDEQKESLVEGAAAAKDDIKKKQADIDAITQTILASKDNNSKLDEQLRRALQKGKDV